MKAKVAVATVSGKAYFLIVKELLERHIEFFSLIPGDPVPLDTKVVITTEKERGLVSHEKMLVFKENSTPSAVVNEAVKAIQGKESYEDIIVGVDPGEVYGLAVLADGKVVQTSNCYSVQEVLDTIRRIRRTLATSSTKFLVKIGNGVPAYKILLETLNSKLPPEVTLSVVSEAGTDQHIKEKKQRRGLRDMVSAMRIAGRIGQIYRRRKTDETG